MEIATLAIKVDSTDAARASRELKNLENVGASVGRVIGALAGAFAFGSVAKALFDTNAEFQRLSAALQTVTGSAEGAKAAFDQVQGFAKTTPYELSEATQAFIDLKTRGMDASMGSLRAYGNMASAFGRSLTDMIRAISGVAMGETEAIKSFGVQARAEGERLALTFKGQTTMISRDVASVEQYFQQLANANFASGMERQAKTLGGALSNLKDQIAATFFAIGNSGVSDAMTKSILSLTQAIADITPSLANFASGTLTSFRRAGDAIVQFKGVLLTLLAVQLASWANAGVAALAAFIGPTVRAIALTTALTVSAGGYGVAASAATVATTAWRGALALLTSSAGMLTIGLAALYAAMRPIIKETEELNDAIAAQEDRYSKTVKPLEDVLDRVRELREENEKLQKVISGDKSVRILDSESQGLVNLIKKNGGDVEAAAIFARRLDTEKIKNNELKEALNQKNQALKDEAKAAEDAAKAQAGYLTSLKEQIFTLGASEDMLRRRKAALVGMEDNKAVRSMLDRIQAWEAEEKAIEDTTQALEVYAGKAQALGQAEDGIAKVLEDMQRFGPEAMAKLRGHSEELDRIKDQYDELGQASRYWQQDFTDALVEMTFTGKNLWRDMVDSMLRDLARLAVQKNVTSPLFDWLGTGLSAWLGSSGGGQTSGAAVGGFLGDQTSGILGAAPGMGGTMPMKAAPIGTAPIIVNINQETGATSTQGSGDAARLGQAIGAKVREVLRDEQRPGGILARQGAR